MDEILETWPNYCCDGSQVGTLMREIDWSSSTLGAPSTWPNLLQAMVGLLMHSKVPKFLVWGPELSLLYNDAYLEILGDKHPAALGCPLPDVWAEIWPDIQALVCDAFAGKASFFEDVPFTIRRNGRSESTWFTFEYIPVCGENGDVTGMYCSLQETTGKVLNDRHRLVQEAQLREAVVLALEERQRLEALLQAAPVGIGLTDKNGKLILTSEANRQLWGEHPFSENIDEYVEWKGWWADGSERHGQRIQPAEWGLARALRGDVVLNDLVEIEPFNQPDTRKTVLLRAVPVRNGQGDIINAVVAQIDITDRVRAAAALKESEAKFRTITDAMPQMVWSTRADGYHDYYNQQWYDFTGVQKGSTDGDGWNEIFHRNDQELAWKLWRHCLESGQPYEIEYRLRHRSGQYRWVLGRALSVRNEEGQIVRWMGTCTDIHEHKLAQEALRDADRRKDEFLAMLAHELRNPLSPITSAAELLQYGRLNEDRLTQISQTILRQAKHMTGLVDDLLDMSRVTRGLISLDKKPVSIRSVVAQAVEQVRPGIETQKHRLELRSTAEHAQVLGDEKRLVQSLANLLSNAAKYTPSGGHIVLQTEVMESNVTICLSDNGVGMSEELVASAFELFVQGERTPDRAKGGLGIGLALVKSLVELHGGSVTAQSAGPGKGSQFTVVLPRLAEKSGHAADGGRDSVPRAVNTLTVLLVDDNTDALRMLGLLLEAAGHQAVIVASSNEALREAEKTRFDACVLDIGLSEIDGYELARRLRVIQGAKDALFIAVTGYGTAEDQRKSAEAGFDYHLTKPANTRVLMECLNQAGKNPSREHL